MGRRNIVHLGFLVVAMASVCEAATRGVQGAMIAAAEKAHDLSSFSRTASWFRIAWSAVVVADVVGRLLVSRVPVASRTRGFFVGSAALAILVGLPTLVGDSLWTHAYEALSPLTMRLVAASLSLLYFADDALFLVGALRLAHAGNLRASKAAAISALLLLAPRLAFVVVSAAGVHTDESVVGLIHDACTYGHLAFLATTAALLARGAPTEFANDESRQAADVASQLSKEWASASTGISTYLMATCARVLLAGIGVACMAANTSGVPSRSDLLATRDVVVTIAVLSGIASLAMIVGVLGLSRVPSHVRASGPAGFAALLMIIGLLLDGATTAITADALGGDLSAAFFAQDALPPLAGASVLLGIAAGIALMLALARIATSLARDDIAQRARMTMGLIAAAGALGALALVAIRGSSDVVLLFAIAALPFALASLVQFLRVVLAVRGTIVMRMALA